MPQNLMSFKHEINHLSLSVCVGLGAEPCLWDLKIIWEAFFKKENTVLNIKKISRRVVAETCPRKGPYSCSSIGFMANQFWISHVRVF